MIPLINNSGQDKKYFEFHLASHVVSLEYEIIEGHGIALICAKTSKYCTDSDALEALIERSLEYIEKAELDVIVRCPQVMEFIGRRPEYTRLLRDDMAHYLYYWEGNAFSQSNLPSKRFVATPESPTT